MLFSASALEHIVFCLESSTLPCLSGKPSCKYIFSLTHILTCFPHPSTRITFFFVLQLYFAQSSITAHELYLLTESFFLIRLWTT